MDDTNKDTYVYHRYSDWVAAFDKILLPAAVKSVTGDVRGNLTLNDIEKHGLQLVHKTNDPLAASHDVWIEKRGQRISPVLSLSLFNYTKIEKPTRKE